MDFARAAIESSASQSYWAPSFAFIAGIGSSFGPCCAPRFVAITGLTAQTSGWRRWLRVGAFTSGLCTMYVAVGTIAGALGLVSRYSTYIYVALASTLLIAGVVTLVRPARRCTVHDGAHNAVAPSGAFVTGLAFALVTSPCCGPIAAVLGGLSVAAGSMAFGALTLSAFALGHALPLVAFAVGSAPFTRLMQAHSLEIALSVVGGAMMIALGAYYAVLA
jgi:cytochrome c-type biogenesis protein